MKVGELWAIYMKQSLAELELLHLCVFCRHLSEFTSNPALPVPQASSRETKKLADKDRKAAEKAHLVRGSC